MTNLVDIKHISKVPTRNNSFYSPIFCKCLVIFVIIRPRNTLEVTMVYENGEVCDFEILYLTIFKTLKEEDFCYD